MDPRVSCRRSGAPRASRRAGCNARARTGAGSRADGGGCSGPASDLRESRLRRAIGYADRMGAHAANQSLSEQRVDAVKAYLDPSPGRGM